MLSGAFPAFCRLGDQDKSTTRWVDGNFVRHKDLALGSEKVKELKAAMEDGPDLGDFIAGVVPREGEGGYSGKLKLEKGKVYDFRWLGYLHCRSMPLAHTVTLSFRRQKVETATLAKNGNSDGKEFL